MEPQVTVEAPAQSNPPPTEVEMAKHGITRHLVESFHYRQFRYTNLQDAIAQAKREGALGPETSLPTSDGEFAKYGITRVCGEYFHCQNFRYTNLNDALAQAYRSEEGLRTNSAGGAPGKV